MITSVGRVSKNWPYSLVSSVVTFPICQRTTARRSSSEATTMATKVLKCRDCKSEFIFTEGEQFFFGANQWAEPVRCKPCRKNHKELMSEKKRLSEPPSARVALGDALAKHLGGSTR